MDDNNNIKKAPNVPPFLRYCSAIIPTAFDDSLSYYEALCALYNYLQTQIVDTINNNATVTEYYINLVKELKSYVENYFANLDVQEEINNKLDEMTENGELLNLVFPFIQEVGIYVVKVGSSDDLQSYLNLDCVKYIILTEDHTVTEKLFINSNTTIDLNGHTLTCDYDASETIAFMYGLTDTFTGYDGYRNITIMNGKIDGACIAMMHNKNVTIEDVEFINVNSRHAMQIAGSYGVTVRNCIFNGTKPENVGSDEAINIDPCNYGGQPYMDESSVMYDHTPNRNILIESNTFNVGTDGQRHTCAVGSHGHDDNNQIYAIGVIIRDNDLGSPYTTAVDISDWNDAVIENNIAKFADSGVADQTYAIRFRGSSENISIINNNITNTTCAVYFSGDSGATKNNINIEGNTFETHDDTTYQSFRLTAIKNCTIKNNNLTYKENLIYTNALSSGGVPILSTYCDGIKIIGNFIDKTSSTSNNALRIKCTKNLTISDNNFAYTKLSSSAGYAIAITHDVNQEGINITNNKTKFIRNFMNEESYQDYVYVSNNTALFVNATTYSSSDLTGSGSFKKPLTYFRSLVLQLGETNDVYQVELRNWQNTEKFDTTNRTYKVPVVKTDGTLGVVQFSITDDATKYSFTGDLAVRYIQAKD